MRLSCQAHTSAFRFDKAMRTLNLELMNWHGLCSLPHLHRCQSTPQQHFNTHSSRQPSIRARCSGLRQCNRAVYDKSHSSFGCGPDGSKRTHGGWQRASAAAQGTGSPVCLASLLCIVWIAVPYSLAVNVALSACCICNPGCAMPFTPSGLSECKPQGADLRAFAVCDDLLTSMQRRPPTGKSCQRPLSQQKTSSAFMTGAQVVAAVSVCNHSPVPAMCTSSSTELD